MKKIIIITILISGIIIGATSGLIKIEKDRLIESSLNNNLDNLKQENNDDVENVKEKTLDLYGTYSQNDLLIIDKTITHETFEEPIIIKQISGLKNKEVENKINKSIEEKVLKEIEDFFEGNDLGNRELYMREESNFSNVLSFYCNISCREFNYKYENKIIGLNYNLVTGEELKFEDLFIKNADIQTIIRDSLYKRMAKSDAYWDEEKGKWMVIDWRYDEELGDCIEETIEYVPFFTDNEISKKIKLFTSGTKVEFYFTPSLVYIIKPEECSAKFEDFADMVVIYDKYLTNESIYERDDIGLENILTCTREILTSDHYLYKKTSFESDNFFYDFSIVKGYYSSENVVSKIIDKYLDEMIRSSNKKIEEYKKLAKDNPNKMYILILQPDISMGKAHFDFNSKEEWHNLISLNYYAKVISGDISQKDELLYKLLGTYRYQNLGMYGSIYYGINSVEYSGYHMDECIEEKEFKVIDELTGKTINSLSEIFKEGVDYKKVIDNTIRNSYGFKYYYNDSGEKIYRSDEEIDEILKNAEYKFSANEIYVIADEYDISLSVALSDLKPYLNLNKLEYYILPNSDKIKLNIEDIQSLSKDELTKAYNEIFARHGHDFKSKNLREYFNRMIWYAPIENKAVILESLSETEIYNANLIKTVIDGK